MSDETKDEQTAPARPALRVVKGAASATDVAVLTAILAVSGGGEPEGPRERRGGWSDPSMLHRRQLLPGPNAWRSVFR